MSTPSPSEITRVLQELSGREMADPAARDRLLEAVYPELHRIASAQMRREREGHTLQPTALVNEAYLKLVDQTLVDWKDRAHFLGIAARAMRQILVDHARRHAADKRGGGVRPVTLDDSLDGSSSQLEVIALHEALEAFAEVDERAARGVELRVFGGLTVEETALILDVSKRTVDSDWAMARLWLARALGEE
jgi:RNA polymerase sigma-70 factor (ECF subfamily)